MVPPGVRFPTLPLAAIAPVPPTVPSSPTFLLPRRSFVTKRRAAGTSASPSAAPARTSDAWCMRTYTRLPATSAASANHGSASARPLREHAGAHECCRCMTRRERRGDRSSHPVGKRIVVREVLLGPDPPEQRLDATVGQCRLGAECRAEAERVAGIASYHGPRHPDRVPQHPVVGGAGESVEHAIEVRGSVLLDPCVDARVERVDSLLQRGHRRGAYRWRRRGEPRPTSRSSTCTAT